MLARFSAMRDRVPTHELLERLLHDTGYLAHLQLMGEDKNQAIVNMFRLLRLARNSSRLSTTQFLRFITQCRDTGSEVTDPIVPRKDAVTITTTHSAKGLEWKVVFWGGLGLGLNTKDSRKVLIGRDTIALRHPGAETQPDHYDSLQSLQTLESLAEEKRLWYVATTRAIERLILCGVSAARIRTDKQTQTADFILSGLRGVSANDGSSFNYDSAAGEPFEGFVRVVDTEALAEPDSPIEAPTPYSPDSLPPIIEPITVPAGRPKHSATEYLAFSTCPRRHWLKYTLGIREPAIDSAHSDSLMSAISRGVIVHDVLERLRENTELDELLDDAIRRSDENAPSPGTRLGAEYRDHLKEEIKRVANHPDYRAIAELPDARNELAFLYIANEEEYYEGSMDLAAVEGERLALLDVKTPQCAGEIARKKAAAYQPQRDVYIAAAEGIGGMEVGRFAFQFSRANLQVTDAVDPTTRHSAARFVSETGRRIEAAERTTTANERECRFCGYGAVGLCCGGPQAD
jgi:ATP-dependent helicase/nuclease subunit A